MKKNFKNATEKFKQTTEDQGSAKKLEIDTEDHDTLPRSPIVFEKTVVGSEDVAKDSGKSKQTCRL